MPFRPIRPQMCPYSSFWPRLGDRDFERNTRFGCRKSLNIWNIRKK